MRKYGNMFRAGDCPNDCASNRLRTLEIRLLCGNTAAHMDMLVWHHDDPVDRAALQILHALFAVPQISVMLDRLPEDARVVVAELVPALVEWNRGPVAHLAGRPLDDRRTRLEAMADHNTTGAYVTGEPRDDWQTFDFAALRAIMRTPSRVIVDTVGGHAFVDPFLPCVVLVNEMRHRGGVRAGELLVTGSFSGFFEVEADEPVSVEFVGFGTAQATFSTA
jgi:hypothetical protein